MIRRLAPFQAICLLFWVLSNLNVTYAQPQISQFAQLSPDQRIIQLWAESNSWGPDTTAIRARVDSLKEKAIHWKDERLYWCAILHQVRYRAFPAYFGKKALTSYAENAALFETCPVEAIRGSFYFLYGQDFFRNKLDFDKAFRLLLRARNIFEKIGYENIPEAIFYLSRFGNDYYWFEDYRTAIHYMQLTARFPCDTIVKQFYCQNTLGMAYQQVKDYKKALPVFQRVIDLAASGNSSEWVGIGSNNYGNVLRLQGKYHEALPYLYRDISLNSKKVPESAALSCLYIARCLIELDSVAKAQLFIKKAQQLYNNYVFSSYRINYYETLTSFYRKTGDFPKATLYVDSVMTLKDSLKTVFNNKSFLLAESSLAAEHYLSTLDRVEQEKSNAILLRNLVISAIFLLGLAGVYMLNQKRQKLQKEKQLQEEQRKQAETKLAHAQAQLSQYVDSLREKTELIERIRQELDLPNPEQPTKSPQPDRVKSLLNSVILNDDDWRTFRQLFEHVHPQFFEKLHQEFTDLTPAEIRLLALLKLNIPTKDMAYMLGISAESIRKSRYRLRKRIEERQPAADLLALVGQL